MLGLVAKAAGHTTTARVKRIDGVACAAEDLVILLRGFLAAMAVKGQGHGQSVPVDVLVETERIKILANAVGVGRDGFDALSAQETKRVGLENHRVRGLCEDAISALVVGGIVREVCDSSLAGGDLRGPTWP